MAAVLDFDWALFLVFTAAFLLVAVLPVEARFVWVFAVAALGFVAAFLPFEAPRVAEAFFFFAGFLAGALLAVFLPASALVGADFFLAVFPVWVFAAVLAVALVVEALLVTFFFVADLVPVFLPDDPAMSASL